MGKARARAIARAKARERKRMKAIASARANPELKKFQVTCPHKSFMFVFNTECAIEKEENLLCMDGLLLGAVSYRVIEMPSNVLDFFDKVDISLYTTHDHRFCADPNRFRRTSFTQVSSALVPDNLIKNSRLVVVGILMYTLYLDINGSVYFMSYNLSNGVQSSLPTPSSAHTFCPKVLSLRGKVYLLQGLTHLRSPEDHPFAEVYDPITNKWSKIAQPPHDAKRISYGDFIVSLGETEGKLLVYHESTEDVYPPKKNEYVLYVYDVSTDKWESAVCAPFAECCGLGSIIGQEVFNEDDSNLYWLGVDGLIYALDWKKRRVYSCCIAGLEHVHMFRYLEKLIIGVSFHHLWSEFFCLVCCSHCSTKSESLGTEYHYTFLRVIKNSSTKSLYAVVLGCFMESYDYSCGIFDAVRV
ncbi:hypothetical protein KSS87_005849 [Heliosperma pusillum]|nr:hypothetical protein KSS87_005849 [Heliosperma pusillum]